MKAFPDSDDDTLTATPASARADGRGQAPPRGRPGGHAPGIGDEEGRQDVAAEDERAGEPQRPPRTGAPVVEPAGARRGRGLWWLFLLVLALAAASGWYYWNLRRNRRRPRGCAGAGAGRCRASCAGGSGRMTRIDSAHAGGRRACPGR